MVFYEGYQIFGKAKVRNTALQYDKVLASTYIDRLSPIFLRNIYLQHIQDTVRIVKVECEEFEPHQR